MQGPWMYAVSKTVVDFVLAFYILDICLVAIDMALVLRNRRLDRERLAKS